MIIKPKKKRNIFLFLNTFMFFRRAKRRGYIDGEDLPDEKNRKGCHKSLWIAVLTFLAVILAGNYLINLFFEVVTSDFEFDLFSETQTEFIWFRWYWLFRIRSLEFFLMTTFLALVLSFVTYKRFGRRIERLNYGQKGDHRFATLKEIKAQYVEIPDKKEVFAGIGGVPVSHHGNKYYIDLDTVNSLFLGTSRSGKGEGHVIPLIDILSRAMEKCAMVVNDPKGGAPRSIVKSYGYAL